MEQGGTTSRKAATVYPKARCTAFGAPPLCRDLLFTLLFIGFVSSTWAQERFETTPQLPERNLEILEQTEKLRLKLSLSVTPIRVTAGNSASFNVAFTPFTPQGSIRYTLWINGKAVARWRDKGSYSHRFEEPGDFQAYVTANLLQREIRSKEVSIAVTKPPVVNGSQADVPQYKQPTANILQQNLTRPQGREALFQASYQIDRRLKIARVRWSGPTGESDNPKSFVVPTQDLKPGTYTISYTLWDSHRQAAEAVAQLHIVARPGATISPKTLTLSQGEPARFEARHHTDRRTKIVTARWSGPTGESDDPNSFVVPTQDLKPGTYTISYIIRDSQRQTAEAVAQLHIVTRPRATISPKTLTLSQGEPARFEANHYTDRRTKIVTSQWSGPTSESDNPNSFVVPTQDLNPGSYPISYALRDSQGQIAEAIAELHIVERPTASISPGSLTLSQGKEARFQGRSQIDKKLKIVEIQWDGPVGVKHDSESYTVPTGELEPASYPIHYHVRDSQGQIAEAQAELRIVAPTSQQLNAEISPNSLSVIQGEKAEFHVANPELDVESQWNGPAGRRDNVDTYTVPTEELSPGTYTIHYIVRDAQGRVAETESVLHITEPGGPTNGKGKPLDGMLIWIVAGGGLLGSGLGLGWWLRSKPKKTTDTKRTQRPPTRSVTVAVETHPESWRGGFEKTTGEGPKVRLALSADLGQQHWSDMPLYDERGEDHD